MRCGQVPSSCQLRLMYFCYLPVSVKSMAWPTRSFCSGLPRQHLTISASSGLLLHTWGLLAALISCSCGTHGGLALQREWEKATATSTLGQLDPLLKAMTWLGQAHPQSDFLICWLSVKGLGVLITAAKTASPFPFTLVPTLPVASLSLEVRDTLVKCSSKILSGKFQIQNFHITHFSEQCDKISRHPSPSCPGCDSSLCPDIHTVLLSVPTVSS